MAGRRPGLPDRRLVPDVAAVADPSPASGSCSTGRWPLAGERPRRPIWAGLATLINDKLVAGGSAPLGTSTHALPVGRVGSDPGFHHHRCRRQRHLPVQSCGLRHGHRSGHAQRREPGEEHPAGQGGVVTVSYEGSRSRPALHCPGAARPGTWPRSGGLALVLGIATAGGVVRDAVVADETTYACPPDCGRPPNSVPVEGLPRFAAPDGAFSVSLSCPGRVGLRGDFVTLTA